MLLLGILHWPSHGLLTCYVHRDDALNELASSYADMDALQATLSDSAVYVRYLRKKVLELELEQARNSARAALNQQDPGSSQFGEAGGACTAQD
jgi:hypothetical protein